MFNRSRFVDGTYKQYSDMDGEELKNIYDSILECWNDFVEQNDSSLHLGHDYYIHEKNLADVIRRCDERILYFYIFKNLKEECEYKEVAILCFWINTLKPFMVVNPKSPIYSCPNEMFSLYLILTVIEGVHSKLYPNEPFKYPSERRIMDILYDFKFCSLSREAMISFVETFADTYGVGIDYILSKN